MQFVYNDGGRKSAGYKGDTRDCVTRSIAIVTGLPYKQVYDDLNLLAQSEHITRRKNHKSNARLGVFRQTYEKYLINLGYRWIPCMKIGEGCKVHLRESELPPGRLIVRLSKHLTAVIDRTIQDTWNPDRDGNRCVYGYFIK